jgi:hypothetical protein
VNNNPFDPLGMPVSAGGAGKMLLARGGQRVLFGPAKGRVFWTNGLAKEADDFAASIGGHTIANTNYGRMVLFAEKYVDPKHTYPLWRLGSRGLASGARGAVYGLHRNGEALGRVISIDEIPRLNKIDSFTWITHPAR